MNKIEKFHRNFISEYGFALKPARLTRHLLSYLHAHYYCKGCGQDWYDSDPSEYEWLINQHLTHDELEEYRLSNICWQDLIADGIWDFTQATTDVSAFAMLEEVKKKKVRQKHKRLWYARREDGTLWFHWFGRDLDGAYDYNWIFKERGK